MAKSTKRGSATQTESDVDRDERKKIRNRLSQRAFRLRRAEHLRELESRANASEQPDGDRVVVLEQENKRLRAHITKLQSQLESIQASIQLMTKSSTAILDATEPSSNEELEIEQVRTQHQREQNRGNTSSTSKDMSWVPTTPNNNQQNTSSNFSLLLRGSNSGRLSSPFTSHNIETGLDGFAESLGPIQIDSLPLTRMPEFWGLSHQMGPQAYANALELSLPSPSNALVGLNWVESNSPFSDHIQLLKKLLKTKLKQPQRMDRAFCQTLYQSVSSVLAMFNSITRPDVMNWYAKTRFFHIVELTAWQIFPSPMTFSRLSERYKPTRSQLALQGQYPCVVDWIPFASIRDLVIQLHAANPCVDQIFCDAVSAYVVESTMSELIMGTSPIKVYIRVTDLIASMSSDQSREERLDTDNVHLPAPDLKTLFSSPQYAQVAFKYLRMDCGAQEYKIDPMFFGKYPELCDPSDDILATGVPLRPESQITLTSPRHLDPMTMTIYSSFINFSLDAVKAFSNYTTSKRNHNVLMSV
ncbi:unnamed protein product [Clonostachys rosea]|uniref:BZIP domain-containing protein n=1 Tax=Bionectria ochroleuca TaxID=29856 RepID=A0ABY6V3F7_BIOOC|nr:unnamed protein product [Clonostachys rosea]